MPDHVAFSTALPLHTRAPASRHHLKPDDPGLCALEDYTCLTGESFTMRSLRAQLRRVAPHFRVALIIGETGTAKETVALALHRLSADTDGTFVRHNAVAFQAALHDICSRSTLLSFTGSPASSGTLPTLFLPDVDELTRPQQLDLLHLLERFSSLRNGSERPRLIFATGRDLRALAAAAHFDRNLYKAISSVEILLPPLRTRPEDIPLITCGLLSRSARSAGLSAGAFDGRALSRLQCHDWPGNVRELERVVEFARHHAGDSSDGVDGVIEVMHLPQLGEFSRTPHHPPIEARVDRLDDIIRNHVLDVLLRCSGNKLRAAERLGISRSTLYRMLDASGASPSTLDRIA